jgi:hypothetical protein
MRWEGLKAYAGPWRVEVQAQTIFKMLTWWSIWACEGEIEHPLSSTFRDSNFEKG